MIVLLLLKIENRIAMEFRRIVKGVSRACKDIAKSPLLPDVLAKAQLLTLCCWGWPI
jgi:hypothetical protein